MESYELLAIIQSFVFSLIMWPFLMLIKYVYGKNTPESFHVANWSDSTRRFVALIIFLIMIIIATYLLTKGKNYYGLLGPFEVFLMFYFIPIYRKID